MSSLNKFSFMILLGLLVVVSIQAQKRQFVVLEGILTASPG